MEKEVKPSQTEPAGVMAKLGRRPDEVSGSGSHYGSNGLKKPIHNEAGYTTAYRSSIGNKLYFKSTESEICFNVKER